MQPCGELMSLAPVLFEAASNTGLQKWAWLELGH